MFVHSNQPKRLLHERNSTSHMWGGVVFGQRYAVSTKIRGSAYTHTYHMHMHIVSGDDIMCTCVFEMRTNAYTNEMNIYIYIYIYYFKIGAGIV